MRKAFNGMKDVTQTLAKAMIKMTEQGSVKPTARAGTARDPTNPRPPGCFECGETDHMVKDCPIRKTKLTIQALENKSAGTRGSAGGGRGRGRPGNRNMSSTRGPSPYPYQAQGNGGPPRAPAPNFGYQATVGYQYPMTQGYPGFSNPGYIPAFPGNFPNPSPGFKKNNGFGNARGNGKPGRGRMNDKSYQNNSNRDNSGRNGRFNKRNGDENRGSNNKGKGNPNQKNQAKTGTSSTDRQQEIMANVALVLDQLHGEWANKSSKNE